MEFRVLRVSKELIRVLCLGDVWLQGFGFLAGSLLAGRDSMCLKTKGGQPLLAAPARCQYFSLSSLLVPAGSPSGTGWLSQGVRSQSWGYSMFPFFCHLRYFSHLTGKLSADEGEEVGGQPHGLSVRGQGKPRGSCGVRENSFVYTSADSGQVKCVARMLPLMPVCTQACIVSLCMLVSRKACVCTQV